MTNYKFLVSFRISFPSIPKRRTSWLEDGCLLNLSCENRWRQTIPSQYLSIFLSLPLFFSLIHARIYFLNLSYIPNIKTRPTFGIKVETLLPYCNTCRVVFSCSSFLAVLTAEQREDTTKCYGTNNTHAPLERMHPSSSFLVQSQPPTRVLSTHKSFPPMRNKVQ